MKPMFPTRQRGFSLVEVMVSVVIGMVVVAAVMVSYLSSGQSGKLQSAYAEMNDNAQAALTMLSRDLQMAGYASVGGINTTAGVKPLSTSQAFASANVPIFACEKGFVSSTAAAGSETCSNVAGTSSLQVAYEADLTNTVPTSKTASYPATTCTLPSVAGVDTIPTDCVGNRLFPVNAATAGNCVFHVYNRYYLSNALGPSNLYCVASPFNGAANSGQPLVEGIESMKITFGVVDTLAWAATASAPSTPARYLSIADVTTANAWARVVSARVCVVVRSGSKVLESDLSTGLTYLNCDSSSTASADGYARRAYTTTVTLRNKMPY